MDPFVERLWRRAQRYVADNQLANARTVLDALLRRNPGHTAARMLLASVYLADRQLVPAAAETIAASRGVPQNAFAVATMAVCLLRVGETVAARECLARFNTAERRLDGKDLTELAHAWQMLGEHATSLSLLERADADGCREPGFRFMRAMELNFNGRFEESRRTLEDCLHERAVAGRAFLALARLSRQLPQPGPGRLDDLRCALGEATPASEEHAALEFALFEELDALGQYDEAFAALEGANATMYARKPPNALLEDTAFDALIRSPAFPGPQPPGTAEAGAMPIFIVGMPRSGTSLLDRMLGNHPDVTSAGELMDFPLQLRWVANLHGDGVIEPSLVTRLAHLDHAELGRRYLLQTHWRAAGKRFYIDKLPQNYMLLGAIHRALPRARILHLVRDPMDTCFSNYRACFGDRHYYSYDVRALASRYLGYRRLMDHWRAALPGAVMDVAYADLVSQPEAVLQAAFRHCGLGPAAGCADPARNPSPISTLSSVEVRSAVHARNVGAWHRYESRLSPLREALGAARTA